MQVATIPETRHYVKTAIIANDKVMKLVCSTKQSENYRRKGKRVKGKKEIHNRNAMGAIIRMENYTCFDLRPEKKTLFIFRDLA